MGGSRRNDAIYEQAETWFVHLESRTVDPDDRGRFEAWLNQSDAHRAAYADVTSLCEGISTLKHLANEHIVVDPRPNVLKFPATGGDVGIEAPRNRRRRSFAAIAATALLGLAALWSVTWFSSEPLTRYSTANAQIRTVTLADGSTVTLGATSAIDVRYTDDERHVSLSDGEAYFSVRPDAGRPFFVVTNGVIVRVVGTQFSVNTGPRRVTVAVAEGAVEVLNDKSSALPLLPRDPKERLRLGAGQKLVVARGDGDLREVKPINKEEAGSWRSGHLLYEDVPLREVIADANRYFNQRIVIASDEVSDLRVTAAFDSGQIDGMLDGLAALLPITVERAAGERIVLRRK